MIRKLLGYANVFYRWKIRKNVVLNYPPEDISIELTNTCNFRCSFCPQSDPHHFEAVSRSNLSPEQADFLLGKIRSGGVRTDVIHWTLDGEPFINGQMDDICGKAIAHRFKHFIFATNGYFCTPNRIATLPGKNEGVTYTLCIDFWANQTLFETHRGTLNSWARIRDNVLAILADQQLTHITVRLADISSFAIHDEERQLSSFHALQHLFPKSNRLKVASRVFHNVTGFVPGILEQKKARSRKYNLCPYPWTSLVIASNGDVVSCCRDLDHKTVLGNLFMEDLQSIWNGERSVALRSALVEKKPKAMQACHSCDLPYDDNKFRITHLVKTGVNRLGILR